MGYKKRKRTAFNQIRIKKVTHYFKPQNHNHGKATYGSRLKKRRQGKDS